MNELRVEANGNKVAVFVNDQRFAETEAAPPAQSQSIGFSFSAPPEGPATYAVDALRAVSN